MDKRNLILGASVLLTIIFATVAAIEYDQIKSLSIQPQSNHNANTSLQQGTVLETVTTKVTSTVTTSLSETFQDTQSAPTEAISNMTMPVSCCPKLPESFAVGRYRFNVTIEGPPYLFSKQNGTVTYASGVLATFTVTRIQALPESQKVNFTWSGTYVPSVPAPSGGATLFDGDVRIGWFVNPSILYLRVSTR